MNIPTGLSRSIYPITNELTGKTLAAKYPVKDANSHLIHGDDDNFLIILNHVLDGDVNMTINKFPETPLMRITESTFTLKEIKNAK